ncbi:MAG: hypothetical protein Q8R76_06740 [Candidatus Omnitrophota bacterium]|nr:hypothetical protein [Candidatus Omnitrophota bacterium]
MFSLTPYMYVAIASYFLLVLGLCYRKSNRQLHARLMSGAIAADITIVFLLQIKKHVIGTALSSTLNIWQQLHVAASVTAVLLYLPVLILGYRLLRHQAGSRTRSWHIRFGLAAFLFRTLGLIWMFSFIEK